MKILVTGARGMLGKDIVRVFRDAGHLVLETDRDELDITSRAMVDRFIRETRPDAVVNCAAYNFVDQVEDDAIYPKAFAINAEGPRHLARACKAYGARFVHYSTDYVFPGEKPEGYREEDATRAISRYGFTKEIAEKYVLGVGGASFVCRLSKIFGTPGQGEGSKESFVALMLRLAKEKPSLSIVHEEVGSPSFTPDIAAHTRLLIEGTNAPGVYHLVNGGPGVTWYEFAKEIFSIMQVTTPYHPVSSKEFPKPARRPAFAALLNTKLPPMRTREEALRAFLLSE